MEQNNEVSWYVFCFNSDLTISEILEEEIKWMLSKRPLVHDANQLIVDYKEEAAEMIRNVLN